MPIPHQNTVCFFYNRCAVHTMVSDTVLNTCKDNLAYLKQLHNVNACSRGTVCGCTFNGTSICAVMCGCCLDGLQAVTINCMWMAVAVDDAVNQLLQALQGCKVILGHEAPELLLSVGVCDNITLLHTRVCASWPTCRSGTQTRYNSDATQISSPAFP